MLSIGPCTIQEPLWVMFYMPPLSCLFSNKQSYFQTIVDSQEVAKTGHAFFTQLSPVTTSYVTIARHQVQGNDISTTSSAGLQTLLRFQECFHALICVCMFLCIVRFSFITCIVLHNHHQKGAAWCHFFRVICNPCPWRSWIVSVPLFISFLLNCIFH